MIVAAGLLSGTLPFVVAIPGAQQGAIIVGGLVLAGLFALYLLAHNQEKVLAWIDRLGQRWPLIIKFGREKTASFLTGLDPLTDFNRFIRIFFGWCSAGVWRFWHTISYC